MTSIFVAKLDFGVTNEQLKEVFSTYGNVSKVTIATDRETGKSRGFAFVEMTNNEEAQKAIVSLDGYAFNGRRIAVKEAEKRERSSSPTSTRPPFPQAPRHAGESANKDEVRPTTAGSTSSWLAPEAPGEIRKSEPKRKKDDKKKNWDSDTSGGKKTKMNAYKKSNKPEKFFDEEEDDWEDYLAFKRKDDLEEDEED